MSAGYTLARNVTRMAITTDSAVWNGSMRTGKEGM